MTQRHDLVIRGGTVFDGSGADPFVGDVAVNEGRIVALGRVPGGGREEIDARHLAVTPGFVDIHTHYDGQATWSERLSPSGLHGATTVILGNCGVGFAPCRPQDRELLVRLMEGIEDIPEVVMREGIPWNWESFPQYLDALAARRFDVDLGVQLGHAPLRVHVMGERGADREPATARDLAEMSRLAVTALESGAIGISTSRSLFHRTRAGKLAPTITAGEEELDALAGALAAAGRGVFQLLLDFPSTSDSGSVEFALLRRIAQRARAPLSFTLAQQKLAPQTWRVLLRQLEAARREGLTIRGQVASRAIGLLFGHELSFNPFTYLPSYQPLRALPLSAKVQALRDPELRRRLLAERPENFPIEHMVRRSRAVEGMFVLGDPPDYEPPPDRSVGALAAQRGVMPLELAYDILLERDGHEMLYAPETNYVDGNLDSTLEMLRHPDTLLGLGDGGAHYGMICDASFSTTLLAHWTRDRRRGERLSLPFAVHVLTERNARAVGLTDRGRIELGRRGDLNVIDLDRLQLRPPQVVRDLPAGGTRLMQHARGYVATIVAGEVVYRDGEPSGALPGRLVRGRTH
jgi:N-acyl-D-aspartate/D-glutamate deacylase